MYVKNTYPLNTADEDLIKLVGTVSYYLVILRRCIQQSIYQLRCPKNT